MMQIEEMPKLTKKQAAVLDFMKRGLVAEHRIPTTAEIKERFNFSSSNSVTANLQALERKGYLKRRPRKNGRWSPYMLANIELTMKEIKKVVTA